MEYYHTNAIYNHLESLKAPQYRFVSGNAWQLIYGDKDCNPLVLVFAEGVPNAELNNPPNRKEREAFSLLKMVGSRLDLRVGYIRFANDIPEIEHVVASGSDYKYQDVDMKRLSEIFESCGLPVSKTSTGKYLNDKTSSAYHHWQRSNLGADITVSDIDLWKLDSSGNPEIIFELKRSYYELEKWEPFTDDYRNFKLLSNLCTKAGLKFKILYNQRLKSPFEDRIDRLKLFSIDFSKDQPITREGIISLKQFEDL